MENNIRKVINESKKWVGYLEKKSNKDLDDFTANAGRNNYTCFARDYKTHTGHNLQAQPWCAMFVSDLLVKCFGLDTAKKLLCGNLYHYCPTGANQFKAAGRWHSHPEPGDVIFFTNGSRAYHTGLVIEVTASRVKTIEGNTSGASGVIENGGGVCQKSYSLVDRKIMGYGRPDYNIAAKKSGWYHEDGGERFYLGDTGEYVRDDWYQDLDGAWYWFNSAGHTVCNDWYEDNGKWYYFGAGGAMVTGLQCIKDKFYYFGADGVMGTEPVTLTPDADGALG